MVSFSGQPCPYLTLDKLLEGLESDAKKTNYLFSNESIHGGGEGAFLGTCEVCRLRKEDNKKFGYLLVWNTNSC